MRLRRTYDHDMAPPSRLLCCRLVFWGDIAAFCVAVAVVMLPNGSRWRREVV